MIKRPLIKSPTPSGNAQYLWAIVVMALVALLALTLIIIFRPDADILIVIGGVTTLIAPTTLSLLSLLKAQETHVLVNSRMERAIKDATQAAFGEGMKQGRETANARTDMLADKKSE